MNIDQVNLDKSEIPKDLTIQDFNSLVISKQAQLLNKYRDIEGALGLGLLATIPAPLDGAKSQYVLKDFMWRVTEELCEAQEAAEHNNANHYVEELIDALHFLASIYVILGAQPRQREVLAPADPFSVIYPLGLAANCLKMKPWKQTPVLTDIKVFYSYLDQAWFQLIAIISGFLENYSEAEVLPEILSIYLKKKKVNEFRQSTNY